jgi:universal stress protein A
VALTTIVAGIDLSVPSEQALARAAALALHNVARLVIVHAQADDAPIENVDNEVLKQLGEVSAAVRAEETKRLSERVQQLAARGVAVELVSRTGAPGEVVSEIAKEQQAELIVVGTHGHTGIHRFLWTATRRSLHESCPRGRTSE